MVDKKSPVPMYEQIAKILKKEISRGAYQGTGFIGAQMDLASRFDVSQITIRKALKILTEEKLVYSRQGMGVYARHSSMSDSLQRLTGITNIMQSMSLFPQVRVESLARIETPDHFDQTIRKTLGPECLLIRRTHSLGGEVIAYAKLYVPLSYAEYFTKEACERKTIYQIYQDEAGVELGRGIQNIKAAPAALDQALMLRVAEGTALLFIERYSYSAALELIEVMELYYEHSQYFFRVELELSASGQGFSSGILPGVPNGEFRQ